ncbi:retrovirus-related pol polyprotein from transposon TNT 1-94 [Tanacetum coccineum]
MKAVFNQMETEVAKCSVERKYFEIEKKELFLENDPLLEQIILGVSDCTVPVNNSCVIAPGMYKLDLEPLSPKLKKNREAHVDYVTQTKEHVDTLREIELLAYVSATCPSFLHVNEKLVAIKAINKTKRVRFKEPKKSTSNTPTQVVQIVLWYLDTGCSKNMTGQRSHVINFLSKFISTVRFRNDHVAAIMGYGDYEVGNAKISRVYYVEGLGNNLFLVGQFCNFDLEEAFHKHTCFVRDLEGVDLLKGSRGSNLYTLLLEAMMQSSLICFLSKASDTKSWLWHQRLSHLNFGSINELAKQGHVRGIPKLKYQKDHLYSACSLGKRKKHTHKSKSKDLIQEKLYLLHIDLCGPMRIKSINEKKYILVIVDDYSRFIWVKFLRSKDKTSEFEIKYLKKIQVRLNATVCNVRIDNGTKFMNQTLKPPSVVLRTPPVAVVAPIYVDTTGTPSSTLVDQDALFASTSLTPKDLQALVLPQDVEG